MSDDINNKPWGIGYKFVTQKLGTHSQPMVLEPDCMAINVITLFLTRPAREFGSLGPIISFRQEEQSRGPIAM